LSSASTASRFILRLNQAPSPLSIAAKPQPTPTPHKGGVSNYRASRVGHVPYIGHVGTVMYVGYEDFPAPETFR
jgi:hypothetical protein